MEIRAKLFVLTMDMQLKYIKPSCITMFIKSCDILERSSGATILEVCDLAFLSHWWAYQLLRELEEQGYLESLSKRPRRWRLKPLREIISGNKELQEVSLKLGLSAYA